MVAGGAASEASETPGSGGKEGWSPGGATEPSRFVPSPLRGSWLLVVVSQGFRSLASGSLAPPWLPSAAPPGLGTQSHHLVGDDEALAVVPRQQRVCLLVVDELLRL